MHFAQKCLIHTMLKNYQNNSYYIFLLKVHKIFDCPLLKEEETWHVSHDNNQLRLSRGDLLYCRGAIPRMPQSPAFPAVLHPESGLFPQPFPNTFMSTVPPSIYTERKAGI